VIDEKELERLLDEIIAKKSTTKLRHENPHALFLIKALLPRGERGLHRKYVIDLVYRN
jgi:hypothetical protein